MPENKQNWEIYAWNVADDTFSIIQNLPHQKQKQEPSKTLTAALKQINK